MTAKAAKTCIAITGTSGLVASNLLTKLNKDHTIGRIIAIDKVKPQIRGRKIVFKKIDLTNSSSVKEVSETLSQYRCRTLIHSALPSSPSKDVEQQHEIQVIGSMHILLACEAAKVQKVILNSTTEIYGALPSNPNFLTEDHPLRGGIHSSFLRDKIDAEKQFGEYGRRFPKRTVTVMRSCTILGTNVKNSKVHFLSQPTVPTVLGFDPLMQFIHINDVIQAFNIAINGNYPGIFNLVGDGVLPISRILKITGKVNLPLPSWFIHTAAEVLWNLNLALAPAGHIDFLKYPCVADGKKAHRILGFEPIYSSREALLSLKTVLPSYVKKVQSR